MSIHPKDYEACRMLINDIEALEHRAHRLGMLKTAHVLNSTKNKCGWELAEAMTMYSDQT